MNTLGGVYDKWSKSVRERQHWFTHLWNLKNTTNYWIKEARIYNGKKTSSTSGAGKTGQPLVTEWN